MKKFLPQWVVLFLVLATLQAATYTKQNSRVTRVQMEVTTANGTVTAIKTEAYLVSSFVNTIDATDTIDAPKWSEARFDLLDPTLSATTITAAGKTVTYPQLAALIRQATLDRANAAGIQ